MKITIEYEIRKIKTKTITVPDNTDIFKLFDRHATKLERKPGYISESLVFISNNEIIVQY